MKDIIITGKIIRRECFIFLFCFAAAVGTNIYAIITFDRPWLELLNQLGIVTVMAAVFYILLWIIRLIVAGLCLLFRKRK